MIWYRVSYQSLSIRISPTLYSRRSLLKLSDKLPAFGAIAENFARTMKWDASSYCAGLWKSDMHMQLLWQRDTTENPSAEKCYRTERYTETSCPSWSWASLRDSIRFEPQRLRWGKDTLEIVECEIEPKSLGYRYGEVQSARLTVHGYVQQAHWTGHLFRNVVSGGSCCSSSVLPIRAVWDSSVDRLADKQTPFASLFVCLLCNQTTNQT
jgi:hypothetical protein